MTDPIRDLYPEPEESKLSPVTNCTFSGPPQALVKSWTDKIIDADFDPEVEEVLLEVYQAGADHELEACCEWMESVYGMYNWSTELRTAQRPKPPSLKEQALESLTKIEDNKGNYLDSSIIRQALKALPE